MSSILDQLGGGGPPPGAGPLGGPPPPGPPPPSGPSPDSGGGGGSTVDVIKQMIEMAMSYMDVETDDVEKAQMAKVLQTLQDFLAREQKELDDAMGGKMSPKLMRQSVGG